MTGTNNDVIAHGWDGPFYRVRTQWFDVAFIGVGTDDALDEVANVDVEVRLTDGSRWSATIVTLAEVDRLMSAWAHTGEALNGSYFRCFDGLIVRRPGIHDMTEVLVGLHREGDLDQVLHRLDEPS